jgi:hypothetical protein
VLPPSHYLSRISHSYVFHRRRAVQTRVEGCVRMLKEEEGIV